MAEKEKPKKETLKVEEKNTGMKEEVAKLEDKIEKVESVKEEKTEEKKEEKKEKPKVKKDYAFVNGFAVPVSTKDSIAICRFVKYKTIDKAIQDLEEVVKLKKSVPMKGEIPHRKGPGKYGSGSGRFPKKTSTQFIILLKSLKANAENNGLENPIISGVMANQASRPFGRFGRIKRKRTHIKITAREKKDIKTNKEKK